MATVARLRTQVGIIGAGPAGLMLAHLLQLQGIESVVIEAQSRDYVEQRVRAGVLEQGTVDLLTDTGVGERMQREGQVHHGIELRFDRRGHRIPLSELAGGRCITLYGQQEVVKDLIRARVEAGGPLVFEVDGVTIRGADTEQPVIAFTVGGEPHELVCDLVAGCDGFHGVSRPSIPEGVLTTYAREYPFAWLGILADVPPSTHELIYSYHERGFALHSLRSLKLSRLYIQVTPDDDIENWPDERVWEELHTRFETDDGWALREGPVLEKAITPMRSFVVEPMQYGRMFLAGDAAHIVPPTGAKGLNLAMFDVRVLSEAIDDWYRSGDSSGLSAYSATCLKRVWRVMHFSWWMTAMLHRFADDPDRVEERLQRSQLEYVCTSKAAATSLAENYVGFDITRSPSDLLLADIAAARTEEALAPRPGG